MVEFIGFMSGVGCAVVGLDVADMLVKKFQQRRNRK